MTLPATSPRPSLRFHLRESTADAHQRLEMLMDLTERCGDHHSYRDLLCDFVGIYAPLEAALSTIDWTGSGIDIAQRAKVRWLEVDLAVLGLSKDQIADLPRQTSLPTFGDAIDGLGALYVLEGATLGGQIILRRLASSLGVSDQTGARFFSAYGAANGAFWRDFVAALERAGQSPGDAGRIAHAANATFTCFLDWFGARKSLVTVARRSHV